MNDEKPKIQGRIKVFLTIIVLILILSYIYLKVTGNSMLEILMDYQAKNVTTQLKDKITFDADSKSSFAIVSGAYVQCTKDGIKYFGDNNWNETYTMTNPLMITEANIIAVGEIKSREVFVFNEKGKLYSAQTDAEIVKFAINKLGCLAVITKTESEYITKVYNKNGVLLTDIVDEIKEIYPVAIDLSADGKYLAISYIDTSGTSYVSRILFYDIENENEYVDSINFNATIQKKDEIIAMLSYIGDNLAVVSDKSIMLVDYTGKELWSKVLSNNLTAIDLGNKDNVIMALGDEFPGGSEYKSGTIVWYDIAGNKIGSYETNDKIQLLCSKANRIVAYGTKTIYGLNTRGSLLWEHAVTQDLKQMLLYDDLSRMFLTYRNSAEIVSVNSKLSDKKDGEKGKADSAQINETQKNNSSSEQTKESIKVKSTTAKEQSTQQTETTREGASTTVE